MQCYENVRDKMYGSVCGNIVSGKGVHGNVFVVIYEIHRDLCMLLFYVFLIIFVCTREKRTEYQAI